LFAGLPVVELSGMVVVTLLHRDLPPRGSPAFSYTDAFIERLDF
jgi:hypothetical protein